MHSKKIDEKIVKYVAKLGRLSLSQEDVKEFSRQLSVILDYINKLNEIDTGNVEPTSHALSDIKNIFREDKVLKSLSQEGVLENAPKKIKEFFGVPKIIE